ncbi:uncharacterized protein SPPG_04324 [Spizellomyces punctatus DAOM BR117]|uniref:Uncharacterized protein n=1 Tax=Spizellomyces punctatus (strain DAOM BR117) TaxID=645134 RepID=A0A0L0HJM5_SPIPD|nr:uncharacterized protein SPPG_04324 [Spizellomyces punctatus DAOM BR117]KND01233.1 hypothetical protein SPPG_04324 [Spizellomyces punctatus DAOM BR117]|eukprot:XP_016609272.1 hypothetical protein SPPG_04324 [Spizellomyces punctatus DAOM BR117]
MATSEVVPPTGRPLLEMVNMSNKLVLDSVYLNGLHALRRFELRNISSSYLTVKLRSTLGSQIAFQLTNENLPDRDRRPESRRLSQPDPSSTSLSSSVESGLSDLDPFFNYQTSPEPDTPSEASADTPIPITTNTVAAAAIGVFGTEQNALHGHQFNQLFNYVNHIDELCIAPGEATKVILAFLPEAPGRGRRSGDRDDAGGDKSAKIEGLAGEDETYDFFEVNGLLFFFAYRIDGKFPEQRNGTLDVTASVAPILQEWDTKGPKIGTDGDRSSGIESWKVKGGSALGRDEDEILTPNTQSPPDYQVTVKFRSRVCRSVLWTDIGDTGLMFDDCVVGGTYFKDFTVWNRSEIDLYWILNTVDLSNRQDNTWLKLSDYDTGEPLDGKPIPSYSPRRIRITFRPREVGEFNYDLQLENANDSGNTVQATIHAVVRSALREESLVVSSGTVLDFGDCSSGQWAKQRLVLRNISEIPLEIGFSADTAGVVFQREESAHENAHEGRPTLTEVGDRLIDRLRELSFVSTTNSDISHPPSAVSSRPSSPSLLSREESETEDMEHSSADLAALIAATSKLTAEQDDDAESEDSDYLERTVGEGVGSNGEEYRRIEEMALRPGSERIIEVCFRPEKDALTPDYRGGRLTKRNFRITLAYAHPGALVKEKKIIQCKARACTSFIEVSPTVVNFGDTDVGTLNSLPIQITNCSDLTARVELRFVSKVLNTFRDEITIPPKQSIEAKIDIYPRKVNPDYRKQITVVNLLNRDNTQSVEVRSTNIDKHRVTFHSLFYRVLTPTSTNFIDFGAVVLNSPVVRTFTIANISKKRLVLEIEASLPEDIKIYTKGRPISPAHELPSSSTVERRERLLESISDRRKLPRTEGSNGAISAPAKAIPAALAKLRSFGDVSEATGTTDYLDLASSIVSKDGRRSPRRRTHVQHFPVSTLKHLRTQFRDRKPNSVEEDTSGRPSSSGVKNSSGLGDDASNESARIVGEEEEVEQDMTKSIDLALRNVEQAEKRSTTMLNNVLESSKIAIDVLLTMLESATGKFPPMFPKPSGEEKYVRARLHLNRELENAIQDGRLVPVSLVEVPAESDMPIVLVFTPAAGNKPYVQGAPRKQDARVFLRLVEFDRELQQPQFEQLLQGHQDLIPVRELMLRSSLCRSFMDLNQKNINFGPLNKNEHRTKTIVIRNNSEAPLLYAIRKSGSIASGDLILGESRMGVVRGYGKREIEFMFDPSLAGPFHERLTIENVQDRENDQVISVKANIRKPAPFFIENLSIDFGPCLINELCSTVQHIVISNTSFKKIRTFEVRIDPQELQFVGCVGTFSFDVVDNEDDYVEDVSAPDGEPRRRRRRPIMMLSKEMEEEIEHLEQKLKIARRKGRKDKVKKLIEKLDKLRAGIVVDEYAEEEPTNDQKKDLQSSLLPAAADVENGETTPNTQIDQDYNSEPVGNERARINSVAESVDISRRPSQLAFSPESQPTADQQQPGALTLPASLKVKRTEHSIVFAIEPRTIRAVAVFFRPIEKASESAVTVSGFRASTADDSLETTLSSSVSSLEGKGEDPGFSGRSSPPLPNTAESTHGLRETCSGVLYVHEHKNTDLTKEVSFSALVCYDHRSYLEALAEQQERQPTAVRDMLQPGEAATVSAFLGDRSADGRSPSPRLFPGVLQSSPSSPPNFVESNVQGLPASPPAGPPSPTREPGPEPNVSAVEPVPTLIVEVPQIELGNIKIMERKDCYFTMTNRSPAALPFTIIPPEGPSILNFNYVHGTLSQKETRRVELWITPTIVGRQSQTFSIMNQITGQPATVTFLFYAIAPVYLRFPSLPDPLATSAELDLGYCYLDGQKKYARIVPYEVENVSDEDLYISAVSNLAQQCFIFTDPNSEIPATEVPLAPQKRLTVYIALQPYLGGTSARRTGPGAAKGQSVASVTAGGSGTATGNSSGDDYRTLVGGIKFLVLKKEQFSPASVDRVTQNEAGAPVDTLYHLTTYTAKFSAVIGQSLLSVSDALIDLGCTSEIGGIFSGSFYVCNLSSKLPLEFRLQSSNPQIELADYVGRLEGRTEGVAGSEQSAMGIPSGVEGNRSSPRERITFHLRCTGYGFIQHFINAINLNNSAQKVKVEVRLFADMGMVKVGPCAPLRALTGTRTLTSDVLPAAAAQPSAQPSAVRWDDIYVDVPVSDITRSQGTSSVAPNVVEEKQVVLQRREGADALPLYEKSLAVENISNTVLIIAATSDLDLNIRWSVRSEARITNERVSNGLLEISAENAPISMACPKDGWKPCSPKISIQPGEKITAYVSIPSPSALAGNDEAVGNLVSGKKFTLRGILCFEDVRKKLTLGVVDLQASYCLSRGEVEPTLVDLGKVGHFNSWNDAKLKFTLRNLADIPLLYELQLPDALDIVSGEEKNAGATKSKVDANGTQVIDAVLKPRVLEPRAIGPHILNIGIVNLFNPRNVMGIAVSCQLTLFELRFERLVSGELVLPPLTHPHIPTALPCDTWFTIVNTADEEVKFDIGFTLTLDVAEFVRLDVLSRFSNSPLVGSVTLNPRGSIEVRVRAYAREDSRLPANHPNARSLTNPDGITFGSLCITSRNQGDVEGNRMMENIPIRGIIHEGQTFTISQKRVEFRSILASDTEEDSEDEDGVDEDGVVPIRRQSSALSASESTSGHDYPSPLMIPTQRAIVEVTNLSAAFPLEFKVVFEYPMELPNAANLLRVTPLDEDMCGSVGPGGRLQLVFELLDPQIGGISDDIKVLVLDKNSLSRSPQVVYVSIVEDITGRLESRYLGSETDPNDTVPELFISEQRTDKTTESIIGKLPVEEPVSSGEEGDEDFLCSEAMSSSSLSGFERGQTSVSSRPSVSDSLNIPVLRRNPGHIQLRGCKRISERGSEIEGLFELDLGQQDLASNVAMKKLLLENPSSDRISYRVRTLSEADKSWISFSRTEGTLDGTRSVASGGGGQRDAHTISVNFMTSARGVYTTYVFIENLDNPADTKIIRVSMEIVARQNIRRTPATTSTGSAYTGNVTAGVAIEPASNHVFDVYVHGADANVSSIVMDHLYFGTEYAARSMIICNRESVPLEFTVHSSISHDDDTELVFSLSRTSAKLFRNVTVEPESQARVYIRLRPSANSTYNICRQSVPSSGQPVIPGIQRQASLTAANQPVEKNVEIYINCRLVKDYQKIINLRAICRQPQMQILDQEIVFRGMFRRKDEGASAVAKEEDVWALQLHPLKATIEVGNLLTDPLDCWVMNDTMFFAVEDVTISDSDTDSVPDSTLVQPSAAHSMVSSPVHSGPHKHRHSVTVGIAPKRSAVLQITPRMDVLLKHTDRLRREKYIVEHLTIYNRRRPKERRFIVLKLSLGYLTEFQSASGSRYSYGALEHHIVRLLKEFDSFPDLIGESESAFQMTHPEIVMDKTSEAFFRFTYIVDQLVYYGTREHAAENYAHLAQLLFSTLFSKPIFKEHAPASLIVSSSGACRCWPPALAKWISLFMYFMEYFPYRWPALEPLRELTRGLLSGGESTPVVEGP